MLLGRGRRTLKAAKAKASRRCTIELDAETAALLHQRAKARGLSVAALLAELAGGYASCATA
ncbi:MAG: hypothetical protein ACREDO_07650 [Methyloceanibacter sp.]